KRHAYSQRHHSRSRIREKILILGKLSAVGEYLRIITGVVGDQKKILCAHIRPQAIDIFLVEKGGGESIAEYKILPPDIGPVFHPPAINMGLIKRSIIADLSDMRILVLGCPG